MVADDRFSAVFITFLVYLGGNVRVGGVRHDCQRPCDGKSPPKICFYSFEIGVHKRDIGKKEIIFLSVNQTWPPPLVEVCKNDGIIIEVRNRLPLGTETAFHWHGFTEGNSPFMDGVPMITQCPIDPHQSFAYHLKALKPGTFFYRSHSVVQQLDGLFGPLIVHDDEDQVRRSQTVVISPLLNDLQTFNDDHETYRKVIGLQVAVYNESIYHVEPEKPATTQKLRIINAAALNCPVTLSSVSAPMTVIALDGNNVKPKTTNALTLHPDDRIDVLVSDEVIQSIRILGGELCANHGKIGLGDGIGDEKILETEVATRAQPDSSLEYNGEVLENLEKSSLKIFLPYDVTVAKGFVGRVDFRFKLGGLTPYAPSFLAKQKAEFFQTYNKTFLYPPSPLLSQMSDIPEDILCSPRELSTRCQNDDNNHCECLGIVNLPYDRNLDLFVIDEGKNSNISQTVHIHGNSFYVLASKSYGRPITAAEVEEEEKLGKIPKNLMSPVMKDSVVVPNKGFVVLRLKTNRTGAWLIESQTSKALSAAGFEFVLNVRRPDEDLKPPENFPKCGTLKGPDLVIID